MGLDMYLYKKFYIDTDEPIIVTDDSGQRVELCRNDMVTKEIAYWRKANAIHKWFVDNIAGGVDECQEMFVTRKMLENLLSICRKIKRNHGSAINLLPTCSGCFFGSTDYDEAYFYDIDLTIKQISDILKKYKEDNYFYYQASW